MGKSSKPIHICVDQTLWKAGHERWTELIAQGHRIDLVFSSDEPDILLAPFAMRMTADMLSQLPASFDLAVKGARALRYGPTAKDAAAWNKGKEKRVQNKSKGKRKNTKVKDENTGRTESGATPEGSTTGGTATVERLLGETPNDAGDGQVVS